jgi:phosphoribosylamine--glycine ligase
MLTAEGPKQQEYNARFGDPETQVLLPRLRSDLARLLLACAEGDLSDHRAELTPEACVTVVCASGGYPGEYRTGLEIAGLREAAEVQGAVVFHAGTAERDGRVVTSGGRVLAVSGLGATFAEARAGAYEACDLISFDGMHRRSDIAATVAEEVG